MDSAPLPAAAAGPAIPRPQGVPWLDGPVVILAPMAGVTDFPFRQTVQKHSPASLVITEMIASPAMVRHIAKTRQRSCQDGEKAAVQIAGNDPQVMAEAARMCQADGACLIDINMGCPVKKIAVSSYAGSALMRDEVLAGRIFSAIVKAVTIPVTVKMRKGWDNTCQNALRLAHIAHQEGLKYITLHGRTRCQLFNGQADWDFIQQVHQQAPLPVIGNGDLVTIDQAVQHSTKASGLMIGRGTYGRPWLIGQIRHRLATGHDLPGPSLAQQSAIVQEHLDLLLDHYGLTQGLLLARKHIGWYSKGLARASEFRQIAFQAETASALLAHTRSFYQNLQDNGEDTSAGQPLVKTEGPEITGH
jgi:tRNA-dihydrouridine synthase B